MAVSSSTVTLFESTAWTAGVYTAYLSPWGAGALQYGVDYTDSLTLDPNNFPNGVLISWSWPASPAPLGVYNFDAIDFGDYKGTSPQTPISSTQINNIGTLSENVSLVLGGNEANFDVITDMFLTSQANNENTQVAEVEIFLHTPQYSANWANSLSVIGTFTDSGHTWKAAIGTGAVPDIVIIPTDANDVLSGSINILTMLDYLVAQGALTGNAYFNGLALGAEVRDGSGSLGINNFAVTYSTAPSVISLAASPAAATDAAGNTSALSNSLDPVIGSATTTEIAAVYNAVLQRAPTIPR